MYSECDYPYKSCMSMYFLTLPSLLHPLILFNCVYTCDYYNNMATWRGLYKMESSYAPKTCPMTPLHVVF